jgi:hypothetical protein
MYDYVNFVIKQLQRLKKAMAQAALAGFRPDGRTLADVTSMLSALQSTKTDDIEREVALNNARGLLDTAWTNLHQACVGGYASMKSVYRKDSAALRAIRRIPKKDESPRETLVRAEITAAVWDKLPPMPNTNPEAPFSVGSLTLGEFNGQIADLRTKIETCEGCDSEEDVQRGDLNQLARTDTEFVSAAVVQGRAQYPEGSDGREWLDTIPLEPSTVAPLQAEITAATSPVGGVVHLEFQATYATSYTIQTRVENDVEFVTVASDVTDESWDAVGVAPGNHQYIVFGVNSRGSGPVSEIATVPVAAQSAQAA